MIPFIARALRLLRIGVSDVIRQVGMVVKPLCRGCKIHATRYLWRLEQDLESVGCFVE